MRCRRRHLAIIDRGRLSVLQSNHHEAAAAEIARRRMRDRQSKRDRDCRIDRIAAALHDVHAYLRSDFVCRRDDAMPRAHRFARSRDRSLRS